jgi:hypothetical protein
LIEEARTNLVLNSVDASSDNAATNRTQTANKANSLTGADDAFLLQANTAGASYTGQLTSVTSGTSYTASRFAKAGASNFAQLSMGTGGFGSAVFANFDLNTGTVSQESNCAAVMTNMGSGWYRCSISKQAVATTSGTSPHYVSAVNSGTANARISEAGNSVYFYGAQTEAGSFPTSYIPTSGSAVTRAADVASLAVSEFGYNQDQGTVVAQATSFYLGTNRETVIATADASSNLGVYVGKTAGGGDIDALYAGEGGRNTYFSLGAITEDTSYKFAFAIKTDDFAGSKDGGAVVTDTSGTQRTSITDLGIGSRKNGGNRLNGHIKSVQYYPLRLSNAQLQALTV